MKLSILFVDDDAQILQNIEVFLRQKIEWQIYFATNADQAFEFCENKKIDIIFTDIRMPGKNGIQLLTEIAFQFPQIIRIVLSAHSDKETIVGSVGIAHQYILKPFGGQQLITRIEKLTKLKGLLTDKNLSEIITKVKKLPALPENYLKLEKILESDNPSIYNISKIIEQDVAMAGRILQLSNSAYFNLSVQVTDIMQSINMLGVNTIKSLVLYSEIFTNSDKLSSRVIDLNSLWSHSIKVAYLSTEFAAVMYQDFSFSKEMYIAGLLHDIGLLIMIQLPGYDENIGLIMDERNLSVHQAEFSWKNVTHAEVGAYLLGVWNIPEKVIEAVLHHHDLELDNFTYDPIHIIPFVHYFVRRKKELYELIEVHPHKKRLLGMMNILEELEYQMDLKHRSGKPE